MAVNNFTVRFSGTVAYTDNSHGSFEASAIWKGELGGVVAQHSLPDSQFHFSQLYADSSAGLNNMLKVLGPGGVSNPSAGPLDGGTVGLSPAVVAPDKTVSSFVAEISGLVSFDDNSKLAFVAQWVNGVVNLFPAESQEAWDELIKDSGGNSFMVTILEALVGAGNAQVAN